MRREKREGEKREEGREKREEEVRREGGEKIRREITLVSKPQPSQGSDDFRVLPWLCQVSCLGSEQTNKVITAMS